MDDYTLSQHVPHGYEFDHLQVTGGPAQNLVTPVYIKSKDGSGEWTPMDRIDIFSTTPKITHFYGPPVRLPAGIPARRFASKSTGQAPATTALRCIPRRAPIVQVAKKAITLGAVQFGRAVGGDATVLTTVVPHSRTGKAGTSLTVVTGHNPAPPTTVVDKSMLLPLSQFGSVQDTLVPGGCAVSEAASLLQCVVAIAGRLAGIDDGATVVDEGDAQSEVADIRAKLAKLTDMTEVGGLLNPNLNPRTASPRTTLLVNVGAQHDIPTRHVTPVGAAAAAAPAAAAAVSRAAASWGEEKEEAVRDHLAAEDAERGGKRKHGAMGEEEDDV